LLKLRVTRENVKFDNYPPVAQSVSRELQSPARRIMRGILGLRVGTKFWD